MSNINVSRFCNVTFCDCVKCKAHICHKKDDCYMYLTEDLTKNIDYCDKLRTEVEKHLRQARKELSVAQDILSKIDNDNYPLTLHRVDKTISYINKCAKDFKLK